LSNGKVIHGKGIKAELCESNGTSFTLDHIDDAVGGSTHFLKKWE
jgi:hypothetical protein